MSSKNVNSLIKFSNFIFFLTIVCLFYYFISTEQFLKFSSNLPITIILINLVLISYFFLSVINKMRLIFFLIFFYLFLLLIEINFIKLFNSQCGNINCNIKNLKIERNNGQDVYLNIFPKYFINDTENNFFPISSFKNKKILGSNENGYFPIILNDEIGFNNYNHIYKNKKIDILILGDSYAQGSTHNYNNSIQGILNNNKKLTISFGMGGNGPIISLGSLLEFGEKVNPDKLVYIFSETNDLVYDLFLEKKNRILAKYLNQNFSQNLLKNSEKIEKLILEKHNSIIAKNEKKKSKNFQNLVLRNIRINLNIINIGKDNNFTTKPNFKNIEEAILDSSIQSNFYIFEKIIQSMKNYYPNEKLEIIYIPTKKNMIKKKISYIHKEVETICQKNNIKFKTLFDTEIIKNPKIYYPENFQHFNKLGNEVIAELISN